MSKVMDERISRFIEIMDEEYGIEYEQDEAEDILNTVDRINREILTGES